MSFVWRTLTLTDTPEWSRLVGAVAEADGTGEFYSAEDLAEELQDPAIDPERDTIAVTHGDVLAAVGQVRVPTRRNDGEVRAGFSGMVHPGCRENGIGTELLKRLETRAVEFARAAFPGCEVQPSTEAASTALSAQQLLEKNGYIVVRYFYGLVAHPHEAFRNSRVRRYQPALDAAIKSAHEAAFVTHWAFAPPSQQRWQTWYTGSRTFRPEFSSVAAAVDGRVDAYVLAYQYVDNEVYIGQVGVRPELRGRGLARTLLTATLAEVAAAGISTVRLDVDTANEDGAGRLYESVGFRRDRSELIYQKVYAEDFS